MHICYVADARSPIAKNWIAHFVSQGHRVTVISSYACGSEEIPGARTISFPFALSSLGLAGQNGNGSGRQHFARIAAELRHRRLLNLSTKLRSWLAPADIRRKSESMARLIRELRPDLVHAMRLPFEGFLAAAAVTDIPLLISIWGNDFTLFAARNRKLRALTAEALHRADALHCDCNRDLKTAFEYGFSQQKPWRILPGSGGIKTDFYFNLRSDHALLREFEIPEGASLVINPRGSRAYVRNDVFFRAIPLVLKEVPNVFFAAVGMMGNAEAERWLRRSPARSSVKLLPTLGREQLGRLFAACEVSVSPSSHDGTPNTLLEAMACGCFPVAGNVESIREWISDGENGILCDESDAVSLASSLIRSLTDDGLRSRARQINRALVLARAEYGSCMSEAEALYAETVARGSPPALAGLKMSKQESLCCGMGLNPRKQQ